MATEKSSSGPLRSEPQVSVKRTQIELITISDDDDCEEDENHTSPSSEGPQDQIPNPISPTSSTTTNISTIYTRTARGISCSSSGRGRESVSRKLIEGPRRPKGQRTHKMVLRHTTSENGAVQQQESHSPDSEDEDDSDSGAVSISNSNSSKCIGGNQDQEKAKGKREAGAGRSQKEPRFPKQTDKNLTRVTPAEGSRYYVCKFCGKAFFDQWKGTRHVRGHTGDKPFKCSYCGKGFSVNYNLTEHETIHTGIKMWKCKFCSRTFRYHKSRFNHYRICDMKN